MFSAFLRLLTLAALAMMPFGMAASASPAHHSAAAASAAHCDEQPGEPAQDTRDPAGCTAGCSMFMAAPVTAGEGLAGISEPALLPIATSSPSLPPETATPPPKHS
jgi:hypothetical protein